MIKISASQDLAKSKTLHYSKINYMPIAKNLRKRMENSRYMNSKYRRMIEGLEAGKKKHRKKASDAKPWCLYILRCSDGALYTGITNDISKRFASHQSGKGARFTRTRLPVELVYEENCDSHSVALIREFRLKSLSRKKKEELIVGDKSN